MNSLHHNRRNLHPRSIDFRNYSIWQRAELSSIILSGVHDVLYKQFY